MKQKEITICGKQVKICYCAATENGYEQISGKNINIFVPTFGKDEKGRAIVVEEAKALTGDYVTLAIAGIVAAYSYENQDPPLDGKEIIYEATPAERNELITTILALRGEWYNIPAVVEESLAKEQQREEEEEGEKN